MKLDRMKIDDIGDNPISLAREILAQIGNPYQATPLEQIAYALGIENIYSRADVSIEGALITPEGKAYGDILVSTAKNERRTRFTLAHELGHYVHPMHHGDQHGSFFCKSKDMNLSQNNVNSVRDNIEAQANMFAAELIMPSIHLRKQYLEIDQLTTESIIQLSDDFLVSHEATFRRIVEKSKNRIAAYYAHENKVRYFSKSDSFPFPKLRKGDMLPTESPSSQLQLPDNTSSTAEPIDQSLWLYKKSLGQLIEQTFVQENGYQITLLKVVP